MKTAMRCAKILAPMTGRPTKFFPLPTPTPMPEPIPPPEPPPKPLDEPPDIMPEIIEALLEVGSSGSEIVAVVLLEVMRETFLAKAFTFFGLIFVS